MDVRFIIALLAIIIVVTPICRNATELDGECTSCADLDILFEKSCYPKIRGCLIQTGATCSTCQNGYVALKNICIREAVFNNNNTTPPPVVIENITTLTFADIKNKFGDSIAQFYTDAHEQILNGHPELGIAAIKSVDKLDTKKGTLFITIYQSSIDNTQYESVSLMKPITNQVSVFSFKTAETQKKDPLTADGLIKSSMGTKLTNFFIYQVRLTSTNYTLYYMNSSYYVYEVKFSSVDIGPALSTKLAIKNMTASDLAKEQLFLKYPELLSRTLQSSTKYDDFYAFAFDSNISASVRFTNWVFQVNKPIQTSLNMPYYDSYGLANFFGFFNFFSFLDPPFNACLNAATTEVPELNSAVVTQNQQGGGSSSAPTNDIFYYIQMSEIFGYNSYDVFTSYSVQGVAKVLFVLRNSIDTLYSAKYNYNRDANFFKAYVNATLTSKVILIPPISSVFMKALDRVTNYYKVDYSANQFIEFKYNKNTNVTTLLSYTVDGQNILNILKAVGSTPQKTQPDLYLNYLQVKKQASINSGLSSFIFNPINTILSFVSSLGTYSANVGSVTNSYPISNYTKISNYTCFDMSDLNSDDTKSLDSYLRSYYSLTGYTLKLVQSKQNNVGRQFRLLYSTPRLKQRQFFVQQLYTLYNVLKVNLYCDGYEIWDSNAQNPDYQKLVSYLSTSGLAGSKIPLTTENNTKNIRGYYNDGKSTYQIVIAKSNNAATLTKIDTQTYLTVPDGFLINKLLIPGSPAGADQDAIAILTAMAQVQFTDLADGIVAYADKQEPYYNLMFKSPTKGYMKVRGKFDPLTGENAVDNFVKTAYTAASFSSCTQFDTAGKCLNCDATQLEYQGSCWPKLEGCKVQIGQFCLRCDNPYVLFNKKCTKSCADLMVDFY